MAASVDIVHRMTRRGQQEKQQLRKARRKAAAELDSERGEYEPPDRGTCRYRVRQQTGDDANTVRIENHTWYISKFLH